MGHAEDDEGGTLDTLGEGRDRDEVVRELHLGKVASVLVRLVDDVGQEALAGDLQECSITCQCVQLERAKEEEPVADAPRAGGPRSGPPRQS